MKTCYYCGPTEKELRPYGPGGSNTCYPCMKESPEREQQAIGAFGALIQLTDITGVTVIGTEKGPIILDELINE